jgi:hypothetical protein
MAASVTSSGLSLPCLMRSAIAVASSSPNASFVNACVVWLMGIFSYTDDRISVYFVSESTRYSVICCRGFYPHFSQETIKMKKLFTILSLVIAAAIVAPVMAQEAPSTPTVETKETKAAKAKAEKAEKAAAKKAAAEEKKAKAKAAAEEKKAKAKAAKEEKAAKAKAAKEEKAAKAKAAKEAKAAEKAAKAGK